MSAVLMSHAGCVAVCCVDSFKQAAAKAEEILIGMAHPVDLSDKQQVLDAVNTCLSSKVCESTFRRQA